MNKYQEAWEYVKQMQNDMYGNYSKEKVIIQELVDKATPKKPNMENQHYICCPNCTSDEIEFYDYDHNEVKLKHCNRCGQALDWSETNE